MHPKVAATEAGMGAKEGQTETDGKRSHHLRITRRFTSDGRDPFESVEWHRRDAIAGDFFQPNVECPTNWDDISIGIVAKLYFATIDGVRESSVRQLIKRVAKKITDEAHEAGYFEAGVDGAGWSEETRVFYDELVFILVNQMAAFNTPVWLNFGVPGRQQTASACFLLSVEDRMLGPKSIVEWWAEEAAIFKVGAGSGINLSNLRGSMEELSTGGTASGPVSYMRPADAGAGTLKSGGAHRRAAKLVCLDADHPDIVDFVDCKRREDERMRILMRAGIDLSMYTAEGERNIAEVTSFQNENISVRVSDEFMRAAEEGRDWALRARRTGAVVDRVDATELMRDIAQAAWRCADPGLLFHDTINGWHTTPSLGPITTCNPCLVGETLVDTAEGRMTIASMAERYALGEKLPMVFSWDAADALPVLRQARRAWVTKMVDEIVEIETDKGVTIRCTPDHRILTRVGGRGPDAGYVEAQHLKPGDRLRKVARWANEQRSGRRYINHRETDGVRNGTVSQARFMWEQAYGPIPDGMDVHHVNEDPTDDRLSNFELVESGAHQSFHSMGERNGRFLDAPDHIVLEICELALSYGGCYEGTLGHPRWKRAVEEFDLDGVVSRGNARGVMGKSWEEMQEFYDANRGVLNDSVVSVARFKLDESIPVYDLEVADTHNFAVATEGVEHTIIVHNCAEVHQNDDTSCNLASLNIARFLVEGDDGELAFDTDAFCHAVDVMITAMDVTCGFTDLPTEVIKRNTREMRQLGLGYMNLGASLMMLGMPYDSDEARSWVSSVTALMTGRAYRRSALLAEAYGPFVRYAENEKPMRRVICRHRDEVMRIEGQKMADPSIWRRTLDEWASAMRHGDRCGYRNSQVSVIAPTGTISFMTGCDTTGCEPAYSLVTHKKLAGAGSIVMVNRSVRRALQTLDYNETQIDAIVLHLEKHGELPNGNNPVQERNGDFIRVREQDMPVFATADGATNVIDPMGHVKMIAAIQPFISGAVSKTCNVVEGTTVEDIETLYMEAWRRGIKALSVYRAGSKATEVLSTRGGFDVDAPEPIRKRLPAERAAIAHRFVVDGHEGYVHAGTYEDGSLGEIFITMGKEGTNISGAMNAWATTLSVSLQYGVPLETLVRKFSFMAFEPSGQTLNPEIANARSIVDYIMRWIASRFLDPEIHVELGIMTPEAKRIMAERLDVVHVETDHQPRAQVIEDQVAKEIGPPCPSCGGGMKRTGACWTCQQCGTNTGCG